MVSNISTIEGTKNPSPIIIDKGLLVTEGIALSEAFL